MSIFKKIAHKAEALKGGAKKRAGRVTGNRRLRASADAGIRSGFTGISSDRFVILV